MSDNKFEFRGSRIHTNWNMRAFNNPTPYKLTEGATDAMEVNVREKIDVKGVGTDVVHMQGLFVVRRDHPRAPEGVTEVTWENADVATEFRTLELYGQSELFGTVRVKLSSEHKSAGLVSAASEGSKAKKCKADMYPVIELPELDLNLATKEPVPLGSKVISIPPVGDVARSEQSIPLFNGNGEQVGELISSDIEVGKIIWEHPLG